jgi:hypothetical protein
VLCSADCIGELLHFTFRITPDALISEYYGRLFVYSKQSDQRDFALELSLTTGRVRHPTALLSIFKWMLNEDMIRYAHYFIVENHRVAYNPLVVLLLLETYALHFDSLLMSATDLGVLTAYLEKILKEVHTNDETVADGAAYLIDYLKSIVFHKEIESATLLGSVFNCFQKLNLPNEVEIKALEYAIARLVQTLLSFLSEECRFDVAIEYVTLLESHISFQSLGTSCSYHSLVQAGDTIIFLDPKTLFFSKGILTALAPILEQFKSNKLSKFQHNLLNFDSSAKCMSFHLRYYVYILNTCGRVY